MVALRTLSAASATLIVGAVLLAGCSGAPDASPATVTVTATATVTAEPETEQSEDTVAGAEAEDGGTVDPTAVTVGEPAEHAGVRLTVTKAKASDTITRNVTNSRQGSGFDEYDEIPADKGGHFIIVEAEVENLGQASMDLTCGWPINIKIVDEELREFDAVDDLYDIKGNPECNAQLQPGFSDTIAYAFMVPKDAKVPGLYFQDTNTLDDDMGVVAFDAAL